jgi:predicted nicotinamide N-methyase
MAGQPREFVPVDSIPGIVRDRVVIRGTTFLIDRPGDMEELVDLPEVRIAFADDEYLPYWADIWPAARMLAKAVLDADWPERLTALELGCGLGVAGLAALKCGLRVIFSDYELTAVGFAEHNARLNGFSDFETLPFDWRAPPKDLQVPIVLGSDVTYEARNHGPLLKTLETVLLPGGLCLFTEPDRPRFSEFLSGISDLGWTHSQQAMRVGAPGQPRVKGSLHRIVRPQ